VGREEQELFGKAKVNEQCLSGSSGCNNRRTFKKSKKDKEKEREKEKEPGNKKEREQGRETDKNERKENACMKSIGRSESVKQIENVESNQVSFCIFQSV
jgi:hypothetical protein